MITLRNILVATDFAEPSEAALRYGQELARRFDATLHVVHVATDLSAYPANPAAGLPLDLGATQSAMEEEARRALEELVPEPDRAALRAHLVVFTSANTARALLGYARDEQIDLNELLREQFYLALPMKPLCKDECLGICPQCGTNRNIAPCDCNPHWEDPRLAGLKNLLEKRKHEDA